MQMQKKKIKVGFNSCIKDIYPISAKPKNGKHGSLV